jgi:hypothetical protein
MPVGTDLSKAAVLAGGGGIVIVTAGGAALSIKVRPKRSPMGAFFASCCPGIPKNDYAYN